MRDMTGISRIAAAVVMGTVFASCMTERRAIEGADEKAIQLATERWRAETGVTNAFDFASPRDMLSLAIALEEVRRGSTNVVFEPIGTADPLAVDTNGLVRISLDDALRIGAKNNREFRTLKDSVYTAALSVDSEDWAFSTSFAGMLAGALSGDPEFKRADYSAGGDSKLVRRKFEQGAVVAGNFAIDIAQMLREDWHSFAWCGDLAVSIPLLRGAGRDVVRESLTQAERDLDYAILRFERYRQTLALKLAKDYFGVLELAQNHRNSMDNAHRLEMNFRRAEMMFKAGRMTRIEFDQAKTDLLIARQSVITTEQSRRDSLDEFKMTLGLSPELPLELKDSELSRLENRMNALADSGAAATAAFPPLVEAVTLAVSNRQDLAVTRGAAEDSDRKAKVVADSLRADLTLEGTAAYDASREKDGGTRDATRTGLKAKFSAPWDRRVERNRYAAAVNAAHRARRTYEEAEDRVRDDVMSGYRDLEASKMLYMNRLESWKTACLRVQANDLFTQSGRSSMRDILEAESALLSARNALCSAVISWWKSSLSLRLAMGGLEVDQEGRWVE